MAPFVLISLCGIASLPLFNPPSRPEYGVTILIVSEKTPNGARTIMSLVGLCLLMTQQASGSCCVTSIRILRGLLVSDDRYQIARHR
jgi:hypothetical protein